WSQRFEPDCSFPLDAICLHAMASRLYPTLPRQSLRALAGYLGHSLHLERRSLGHVEASAFVWRRMCQELAGRGIVSWEELKDWLAERAPPKPRSKKPQYPIDSARYRMLPDQPGVYRFLRSNSDVLYVGKATSLKKRTASHFRARPGTPQSPEMLTQVADIAVTVTASALEACLLENELIKQLRPPYNVQLTVNDHPLWFSRPDFQAARPERGAEFVLGPLSSELSLRPLAALISLLEGVAPSLALRAQVVGVSALYPPDEVVFGEGWSAFVQRHAAELETESLTPRRRALRVARKLTLAGAGKKEEEEDEAEATSEPGDRRWDGPRVVRHIERAVSQAYRSYRRARWLDLLQNSEVIYREPGKETQPRLLLVKRGEILEARDAEIPHETICNSGPCLPTPELRAADLPSPQSSRSLPSPFDRAKYDRLRILTTELKRILRDGGEVSVHVSRGSAALGISRRLPERWLSGALKLV
ncbi:MAG TPA: GIY-YIG nuclease family protein, partial [Polyangiaceae bacterium]|nr:GIY-YIG nuclease family protein [Polyangiaceae bacterium]